MGEFTVTAPVGPPRGETPSRNRVGDVKVVQFLLNAIPAAAGAPENLLPVDGDLTPETAAGIVSFQRKQLAGFFDGVVEPNRNTIKFMNREQTFFSVGPGSPFTNEELRSWAIRKAPAFNFTRQDVAQAALSFSSASQSMLPDAYQRQLRAAILKILDPTTFDPTSWGVSPVDLYHVHVIVPKAGASAEDMRLLSGENVLFNKRRALRLQAAGSPLGIQTVAQAQQFKALLAGMTGEYRQQLAAAAQRPNARLEYHSFELDQPTGMQPSDPRRHWRALNLNAPVPLVERSELHGGNFRDTHYEIGAIAFLVDKNGVIHAAPGSGAELSAIAELPDDALS